MMRPLIATMVLLFLSGTSSWGALPETGRMNVLFINIEDCNAGVFGCYGNTICKTPNIDQLARSGVRFDSAYCQAISCNPSRSSFLTGLRPSTTGIFNNNQVMQDVVPPGTLTLPEILKNAGFVTADVGKLFHGDYGMRYMSTFDRIEFHKKPDGWTGPGPILNYPPVRRGWEKAPADEKSPEYRVWKRKHSDRYGDSGFARKEEHDYRMSQSASALLREFAKAPDQRFFLAVSQSKPHTPLISPKQYVDMYDPEQIPLPPAAPETFQNMPSHYVKRSEGGNPDIFYEQQPTPQQMRETIAAYYACVSFVDDNIGDILRTLDETGLSDRTIVIFLGDHGFHLGDHHFWSKYSMLEATRRVPLIVRVPGAPANGSASHQFVELVDLIPTIGELTHAKVPSGLEGLSFVPLLEEPERPWKSAVFMSGGSRDPGEMVRNRRFSYFEYPSGEFALFDLEKDPWETRNVVDQPSYARAREEMAALLNAGWKGALPADRP
ncbi:sulfatase [Planctomicrobium sp. SH664]|uniref:sulfatase n=1 Tax=Planctomicrobium sp. SH664 TaxID=3448125 RepID=UPI003F5C1595